MGCWDEYCVVCGGPPGAPDSELEVFGESVPGSGDEGETGLGRRGLDFEAFEWLESFVGINETEELISLGEYADSGCFYVAGGETEFSCATVVHGGHDVEPGLYGLVCHEKCYRVLERELQYTIRFKDVWPMLMGQDVSGHLDEYTDYGGMEPYLSQCFLFEEMFRDGKEWMLQDPMTHRENAERILQVWRPIIESGFKVVAKPKRPAPKAASAGVDDNQTAAK